MATSTRPLFLEAVYLCLRIDTYEETMLHTFRIRTSSGDVQLDQRYQPFNAGLEARNADWHQFRDPLLPGSVYGLSTSSDFPLDEFNEAGIQKSTNDCQNGHQSSLHIIEFSR